MAAKSETVGNKKLRAVYADAQKWSDFRKQNRDHSPSRDKSLVALEKLLRFKGWRVVFVAKQRRSALCDGDKTWKIYRTPITGKRAAYAKRDAFYERDTMDFWMYEVKSTMVVRVFAKEKKG